MPEASRLVTFGKPAASPMPHQNVPPVIASVIGMADQSAAAPTCAEPPETERFSAPDAAAGLNCKSPALTANVPSPTSSVPVILCVPPETVTALSFVNAAE